MDLLLQAWGGGFYLLNKLLFALAEGRTSSTQRRFRVAGWLVYLLGVPAWVMILVGKHDWIAASIEAGGVPAMLYGLLNAYQVTGPPHQALRRAASFSTYAALGIGLSYSLYDYGGITAVSQLLEMGVMVGFLLGSYLLAQKNLYGWLLFVLMNVSMASLMFTQHKPLLAAQQLLSLSFVLYGFVAAVRALRKTSALLRSE